MATISQKITPFLWFDTEAEEAVNFYTSIFKDAKVGRVMRTGDAGPPPKGRVLTIEFTLEGMEFVALNGGPQYKFTEAVSFQINCETQKEVDHYWDGLLAGGGTTQACGWLKDKYGLSWQVTPVVLYKMLTDPDAEKSGRAMKQMMEMVKLDIAPLQKAYEGK
jgi:predicted 3-demethylubiquinone-9 3-methyltransferase (glyoxalase superfamily)